jgi:death-on-curing family protein
MAKKRKTVRQIAKEAKLDVDDTLIMLWDHGFDTILNPDDFINSRMLNCARRAIGLATRRELKVPNYWQNILKLNDVEFEKLLCKLGIVISKSARYLPKKGISRLKAEARKLGIDHISGLSKDNHVGPEKTKTSFKWRTPGHEKKLRLLNEVEVLSIHVSLENDFAKSDDPIEPPGLQSKGLLSAAVFHPHTANGGIYKYPTVETSAAALLYALAQNHAFYNGNKRTGLVAMLVFLDENGFVPNCSENELFKLVLQVSKHNITPHYQDNKTDREILAISDWLYTHIRPIKAGDHSVSWFKLRRILKAFGCDFETPRSKKNRTNIIRKYEYNSFLGFKKTLPLKTYIMCDTDGREIRIDIIKKIRKDLYLDDAHGIDSHSFYNRISILPSDFILRYRKTLKRLAKF